MASTAWKTSLADNISALITARPDHFDSEDETVDTKAKVERYEGPDNFEAIDGHSLLRRRNADLAFGELDGRYAGKKVARKDICIESNDDNVENMEDECCSQMEKTTEYCNWEVNRDNKINLNDEANLANNDGGSDSMNSEYSFSIDHEDSDDSFDTGNPLYRKRRTNPKLKTISKVNVGADIDKANCVRNQLKIWENILEMRIKVQKCIVISNQMPQYNSHKHFKTHTEFAKKTGETKHKVAMLLNNMLKLQNCLLKQFPETKNLGAQSKKSKTGKSNTEGESTVHAPMDDVISSSEEEEEVEYEIGSGSENKIVDASKAVVPGKILHLLNYPKLLERHHRCYAGYKNSVIQKWNERTRIRTGNLNKGRSKTILKQIEFSLNDKEKLYKRTQLKRSEYKIVGESDTAGGKDDGRRLQEYNHEIYDDDDFYHQLLRDLIEYKSMDITDPVQLSKQWIQLQNMRSKIKKKIDTRATKGRRIRYDVHNKLLNFMAPIAVNDTWADNAKNELYNSLFGKVK